ncbi:MAG: acyl-CoA dehydrogenase family protein, partial [Deltaproteobacteria bacterium]|nr:acyl-CoA dehydrogenase family protein [Deltaproteobacteria bacterium]
MQISYSRNEEIFRDEVRLWLKENVSDEIKDQTLGGGSFDMDLMVKWHKKLYQKGWVAPEIAKKWGGAGFSQTENFIFGYEYARSGAPRLKTKLITIDMLTPLLLKFGTKEQQERFIPNMISGEIQWAQGYSEPDAGSDLANLSTEAVLDGDDFIVNGQKIWTSMADYAHWMFMLVRTDTSGKKQQGISFLLVDLKSPGITIRPTEALTDHEPFCEVFFDNVRVPKENLVGKINEGWTIAKVLLEHERLNAFSVGEVIAALKIVAENAGKMDFRGKPLLENPIFRRKLVVLEVDCKAFLYTFFRIL